MKKNLLSVLILALVIVNIVMNAIMMISVIGTNSKTGDLVASVAAVLNLELYKPGGESAGRNVSLDQTAVYSLNDRLMIQLKKSTDAEGKATGADMVTFYMALDMNKEHDDYAKYGTDEFLNNLVIEIKAAVAQVVQDYTEQEFRNNTEAVTEEILIAIQDLFGSDFVYKVVISDVVFQ